MIGIQRTLVKAPRLMSLVAPQTRSVISTPPRVRISFAEKVALGIVLYVSCSAVPLYISANLKNYRGSE